MNILIVDDDFLVAGALKTILETQEDFHVPACGSDGSEAAALFRQHRPDVLLMDIRMKDMNGLDASAEILREFPEARIGPDRVRGCHSIEDSLASPEAPGL